MLFGARHDGDEAERVVAVRDGADVTAGELWRQATAIAARLPAPSPGSMVAFAFADDRGAFAAALLGVWLAGHGAALPENALRESVMPILARPDVVAFVHDTGVGMGVDVPRALAEVALGPTHTQSGPATFAAVAADPQRVLLATHTAQWHGRVREQRWTAAELRAAIAALAKVVPMPPGSVLVDALSPMFLPSVLAGLLLPLEGGARFLATSLGQASVLSKSIPDRAHTLLGSPVHLRELAMLPSGTLRSLRAVICAGALPPDTAARLRQQHGVGVHAAFDDELGREPSEHTATIERLLAVVGVDDAAILASPLEPNADAMVLVPVVAPDAVLPEVRAVATANLPPGTKSMVRALPRLPRDANGRLVRSAVFVAFGLGRDGSALDRSLTWRAVAPLVAGERRFRTQIPARYAFFAGHFPTYPVLAGAVQLHELVQPCVRAAWPQVGALQQLDGGKFSARIAPGDDIEVVVRRASDHRFEFSIWRADVRCTWGALTFASAEA